MHDVDSAKQIYLTFRSLEVLPLGSALGAQVRKLLLQADKEFVPPLSARTSSIQATLDFSSASHPSIEPYFAALCEQSFLLANSGDALAGFMSYIMGHTVQISSNNRRCVYVSTVIVAPKFRGSHITRHFYQMLKRIALPTNLPIITRTWNQNYAHLHILDQLGFTTVETIENHRGHGISTVYLQWSTNE